MGRKRSVKGLKRQVYLRVRVVEKRKLSVEGFSVVDGSTFRFQRTDLEKQK